MTVEYQRQPQPEGSFGARYEDLIPADAADTEYEPRRFSLIAGKVLAVEGDPLESVEISLRGHAEYGTVFTDGDGEFAIPAEGGSVMTVSYRMPGRIPAHRKLNVPWNEVAIAETVHLADEDTEATGVVFDGDPETTIVHRATPVSDEFGTRSPTMVFSGDNRAYETDENGDVVAVLDSVTVRATEFSTPESMPAKLPTSSSYTYWVEFAADGYERVRFDKPVAAWVENILGFEVGEAVPAGSYDRDTGLWKAEENGAVVMLLDTDSDGVADALDANGDGLADDLDGDGSFADEVAGLDDPAAYPPGASFWRVEVPHFSPWDFNWCSFYSLTDMHDHGLPENDGKQCPDCDTGTGSHVEGRSRIFHEDIPVPGTDFPLHYASDRVP